MKVAGCVLFVSVASAQYAAPGGTVVDLGIAAPNTDPYPEVSERIAQLEGVRERAEDANMNKLTQAYNAALTKATAMVSKVCSTSSFFEFGADSPIIEVTTHKPAANEAGFKERVSAVETMRQNQEESLFNQASAEFNALANVFIANLRKELSGNYRRSFLAAKTADGYAKSSTIRISGDNTYPTFQQALAAAEERRDLSEQRYRDVILSMQQDFLHHLLDVTGNLLRA